MSPGIDLMPQVCRDALGKRAWVRAWVTAYTLCLAATFVIWWAVGVGWSAQEERRAALGRQVSEMYARNEEIQKLLKAIEETESSITRHNRLAWPVRLSETIDTVAALTPEGVSLNTLAIAPREARVATPPAAAKPAAGKDAPKPAAPRMQLVIEAEGIAANDGEIAAFVAGLESSPLFERVGLDYTRSVDGSATGVPGAREFRVTCEIDLTTSYEFAGRASTDATSAETSEGER